MCFCKDLIDDSNKMMLFQQFEEALMTGKKILNLDQPMTLEDCAFLGSVYLPCRKGSLKVDLRSLSTAEIQDFAIVFKLLDGKNIHITTSFFRFLIVDNVGSVRPITRARGSCKKRSTNKLQMNFYVKYSRIKLSKYLLDKDKNSPKRVKNEQNYKIHF